MRKPQWIAVGITLALLVVTYWGCSVRPPEMEDGFQRGPMATTGLESLIRKARTSLTPVQIATLSTLEDRLESQQDDSARVAVMEQMASEWYRANEPSISGIYAQRIAELRNTEEAWSIAGTTFSLCLQQEDNDAVTRQFCATEAERSYQAAISINPRNPDHRINLALTYTDNPPPDNPMKGILMLRELEQDYPNNAKVYLTLAQLAIKTNQLERAAQRLETARGLAPDDPDIVCVLARVYEQLNQPEAAALLAERCGQLLSEES